jgi:cytochrome c peroxidase
MNMKKEWFSAFGSLSGILAQGASLFLVVTASGAEGTADYDRVQAQKTYRRPAQIPHPKDNPPTPERVELGKALFFDPRLSGANSISCASCHNPSFSWGDGLPKGIGHGSKPVGRRTPTILNTAWAETLFWDGRASSLEEQALGPIAAPGEMNLPLAQAVNKIRAIPGYGPLFAQAYPGEGISEKTIAKAIANFERTVVSPPAPFDDWLAGTEDAIPEAAKRGFDLFNTKANCVKCHSGWNLSDGGYHDIGLSDADIGRAQHLPMLESMQHAFKTPTLRDVARRSPYMHDGSEPSLRSVVEFYNRGGVARRPSLAPEIVPLQLSAAEIDDLCAFMETLTSQARAVTLPILPTGYPEPAMNQRIVDLGNPQP